MYSYRFQYLEGQSAPHKSVSAENDIDAHRLIAAFIAGKPGRRLVAGSITKSGGSFVLLLIRLRSSYQPRQKCSKLLATNASA